MEICLDERVSSHDLGDINFLLKQLNPEAQELMEGKLETILARAFFLFARLVKDNQYYTFEKGAKIVGMACLVPILTPSHWSGRIMDLVVDENYRSQGIAKKLIARLIDSARTMGLKHLDLTSRPDRIVANQLYQKLGFDKRETNVYRLKFT